MRPDDIAALLPDVIQRSVKPGSPVDVVLGVMAALHEPVEQVIDGFERYVDPYRCPHPFTPYLASWVGLGWLAADDATATPATGDGPLRHLVADAAEAAKRRGTAAGLRRMLELATATTGFSVDEAGEAGERPFHVRIIGPEAAAGHRDLVAWLIRHEKPAFVTAELAFGDEAPSPVGPRVAPPDRHRSPDGILDRPAGNRREAPGG
jgi:phage tail-like protein